MLVFALSVVVSLVIAEIGFRIVTGVPIFDATDWRAEGVQSTRTGDRAIGDPLLGWTLMPHYRQRISPRSTMASGAISMSVRFGRERSLPWATPSRKASTM